MSIEVFMTKVSYTVSINTSKFRDRYTKYVNSVKEKLRLDWESILFDCLNDILSRAPSEEQEYNIIQGYTGGDFIGGKPYIDESGGIRKSFLRGPGLWLQQLIKDPSTYTVDSENLKISLGHLSQLEEKSRFSWINYSKKLGAIEHTSEYGVASFFEYGHRAIQVAKYGKYRLKPYSEGEAFWLVGKTYPRLGMYTDFNKIVFTESILKSARSIEF